VQAPIAPMSRRPMLVICKLYAASTMAAAKRLQGGRVLPRPAMIAR